MARRIFLGIYFIWVVLFLDMGNKQIDPNRWLPKLGTLFHYFENNYDYINGGTIFWVVLEEV